MNQQLDLESTAPDWRATFGWRFACGVVLLAAALTRCYKLALSPFHHDEGVNGFFLLRLVRSHVYEYNPENYHGPNLYYFARLAARVFGISTVSMRLVPALFGVATVVLVLTLRRHLGTVGTLAAAALIAVAPGAVYVSRYFIHESLFVFFTLGLFVAAVYYLETANVIYLCLAAICGAQMFATKETAFISIGVLTLAVGGLFLYEKFARTNNADFLVRDRRSDTSGSGSTGRRTGQAGPTEISLVQSLDWTVEQAGGGAVFALHLAIAFLIFLIVYITFFTSFFTHPQGLVDSFKAFAIWQKTGTRDHTGNGTFAYFYWMRLEAPVMILGAVGAGFALKSRRRVPIAIALWAWGLLAAYTLIKYKTPWIALNFVVPLALVSGYCIDSIWRLGGARLTARMTAGVGLVAALVFCGYNMVELNLYHYDDDKYPYVYAHTHRSFLLLVQDVERLAARGKAHQTEILIDSPDYWPLPWYLRDYEHVAYQGHIARADDSDIVVGRGDQRDELDQELAGRFRFVNAYDMRPGVKLLLYARPALIDGE